MASTMTTNLLRRNFDMALASGSTSRSGNASPSSRSSVASQAEYYLSKTEDVSPAGSTIYDIPKDCEPELLLRRIPRNRSADHGLLYSSSEDLLVRKQSSDSGFSSPSKSMISLSSYASYTTFDSSSDLTYDRIIDALLARKPNPFLSTGKRNLFMFDPAEDDYLKNERIPPLMIKRLNRFSVEASLLHSINEPSLRLDPWNASPHILAAVERGAYVYLCMKQLSEYNDPPLLTVEHYIDFFRQVLERLSFLHEYGISGLSLAHPSSYMMDTSSWPLSTDEASSTGQFDRSKFPVHYYFVNFTEATRIPRQPLYPASTPSSPGREILFCTFQRDIRDCGIMFENLLADVPQIAETFQPFIEHMKMGHFTPDFFETLRNSLDNLTYESPASAGLLLLPAEDEQEDEVFGSPPTTAKPWKHQFFPLDRSVSH